MKLIVIRAYSDKVPGDEVDLPVDAPEKSEDGSWKTTPPWSELYLAEPDHVQAQRAVADRKAADAAAAAAEAGAKAAKTPPAGGKPLTPTNPPADGKAGT